MFAVSCLHWRKYFYTLRVLPQRAPPEFPLHSSVLSLRGPKWAEMMSRGGNSSKKLKGQEKVEQCGRSPPRAEVLLHPRHVGLVLLPLLPLVLRHQRLRGDGGDPDALRELVCASARQHHVRRLRLPVLCGVQKRTPIIVCTLKSRLTFRPSDPCVGKVTFSITARASVTGLAMFFTEDTAPQASVRPSMIMASSSTSPSMFRVAPWPAGKWCNQSLPAQEFLSGILMADGQKVSIEGGLGKTGRQLAKLGEQRKQSFAVIGHLKETKCLFFKFKMYTFLVLKYKQMSSRLHSA